MDAGGDVGVRSASASTVFTVAFSGAGADMSVSLKST